MIGGLVRLLVRLAIIGGIAAWLADRWLGDRAEDGGPAPIRASVEIDAPIEHVWAVLVDIDRQPEWMLDLREVEILTPPPVGVGTRATARVQALGISVDDPIEITAFEPPVRYSIRHDGLVRGHGDIHLVAERDGDTWSTLVTWEETLITPILPHLGGLVLAAVFGPIFQRDLERLAALVEAG